MILLTGVFDLISSNLIYSFFKIQYNVNNELFYILRQLVFIWYNFVWGKLKPLLQIYLIESIYCISIYFFEIVATKAYYFNGWSISGCIVIIVFIHNTSNPIKKKQKLSPYRFNDIIILFNYDTLFWYLWIYLSTELCFFFCYSLF